MTGSSWSFLVNPMDTYNWYSQMIKPAWAPPGWLFGPLWTVLYAVIAVTYGIVFYKTFSGKLPWMVALPFAPANHYNLP